MTYPIDHILPHLKETLARNPAVVLHAPPGAGKTTRVPLALLDLLPGRIVMLEPRRIAATSAARWMAKSLNQDAGGTVGYSIRFDSKITAGTRIEVVTEGILTRRIQSDPGLEGVSLVIFDEFHERSIHADLALALCLDIRKSLRTDLKLLVMSATLDCGPIAALLGNAPVVSSEGKAYPVDERFREPGPGSTANSTAAAVRSALRESDGDILAFLPGSGEIRACTAELQQGLDPDQRISLHPLYGDLPFEEQERAILPSKDRRKIVIATNIAETSLTIEGVRVVVDSGLTRRMRYDPATGMNRLVTVPVSRASAEQRKGRAGRLGPGVCYRLYTARDLQSRPAFTPPEILESDLSSLALELAAWGVTSPSMLAWLDPPPAPAWNTAQMLLRALGALDEQGSITPPGRDMARLPVHPRLGRLMKRAAALGCAQTGVDLAALLSERDIVKAGRDRTAREPDLLERLEMLRSWRADRQMQGRADSAALRAVDRTASLLLRLVEGGRVGRQEQAADSGIISRLLLSAFPDRVCRRREEGGHRYVTSQGRGMRLSPDSHLINDLFIIAVTTDAGEHAEGFVHIAAPVSEDMIRNELPGLIATVRTVEWNGTEGRITAAVQERLGAILLSKKNFAASDDEAGPLLCRAIRDNPGLLVFSGEAHQFRARAELMRRSFPEEGWPDLSMERLLAHPEEWLPAWLSGMRTSQHLRTLNLLPALKALLSWEQKRQLDERAPVSLAVPSGSRVSIDYTAGEQPVLAVKLQEMFGLADTPVIAGGRVKLLLHLLSPARRPVQITQDLKGFWNSGYQLVKKDLKGRYPKHPWPDDPWNAAPTRRTKPKGT